MQNMNDFIKSSLVSIINLIGPITLLVSLLVLLDPDTFSSNFRNYFNVVFLSTFITLQTQSTMLRRNVVESVKASLKYFIKRSIRNVKYGISLSLIIYYFFNETIFTQTTLLEFIFCILAAYFFQLNQGVINIFIRRRALNKQLKLSIAFYTIQIFTILLIFIYDDLSTLQRILAIVFSSFTVFIIIFNLPTSKLVNDSKLHNMKSNEIELNKYEVWLIPHAVSNFLIANFDRVFISNNFAGDLIREYIVINQIMALLSLIPISLNRIIVPRIFDNEFSSYLSFTKKMIPFVFYITLAYFIFTSLVIFILPLIIEIKLINIYLVCTILASMHLFNAFYLIAISVQHHSYDTKRISAITVFISLSYVIFVLNLQVQTIVNIIIIAMLAQITQTGAILWDLRKKLNEESA